MKEKILTALSGGVDSSATAAILLSEGYDVGGATMRLCEGEDLDPTPRARDAAETLGIPFYSFDMRREFRESVIRDFIDTYMRGETPNPCIVCNKTMKFGTFIDRARELGYEKIATGHYGRIAKEGDRYLLYKSAYQEKDQSYVLWSLSQDALSRLVLPLDGLSKDETRAIAERAGLAAARSKESQDICFVPDGDYASFIKRETGITFPEGEFVTDDGKVLGTHKGIIHYTVGQRRGLGLALPAPLYVKEKDTEKNRVILCPSEGLFSKGLTARETNWIACDTPAAPIRLEAKIRYGARQVPCTVIPVGDDRVAVEFDEAQRAISPGQSLVFYDGDCVVGGGIIEKQSK